MSITDDSDWQSNSLGDRALNTVIEIPPLKIAIGAQEYDNQEPLRLFLLHGSFDGYYPIKGGFFD